MAELENKKKKKKKKKKKNTRKALDQVILNILLNYNGDYVRIVCATSNAYRPAFVSSFCHNTELAHKLITLSYKKNNLQRS